MTLTALIKSLTKLPKKVRDREVIFVLEPLGSFDDFQGFKFKTAEEYNSDGTEVRTVLMEVVAPKDQADLEEITSMAESCVGFGGIFEALAKQDNE